jgi:hypothetical protein
VTYREIPNDEAERHHRVAARGSIPMHRAVIRQQQAMLKILRQGICLACGVEFEPPRRGRPPRYCAAPDCQRRAAADRQARKRRRDQGLPLRLEVQAPGGRSSLLARTARRRARDWFPSLTLTAEDLAAIELLVPRIDPAHGRTLERMAEWLSLNHRLLRSPAAVTRLCELIDRQRDV